MKILQTGQVERSFGEDPTNIKSLSVRLWRFALDLPEENQEISSVLVQFSLVLQSSLCLLIIGWIQVNWDILDDWEKCSNYPELTLVFISSPKTQFQFGKSHRDCQKYMLHLLFSYCSKCINCKFWGSIFKEGIVLFSHIYILFSKQKEHLISVDFYNYNVQ